jgi:hypothetical protein
MGAVNEGITRIHPLGDPGIPKPNSFLLDLGLSF